MVKYLCVSHALGAGCSQKNARSLRCPLRAGTNPICGPCPAQSLIIQIEGLVFAAHVWAQEPAELQQTQGNVMYGKVPSNYTTIVLKLH
jgi:hypothetical protein